MLQLSATDTVFTATDTVTVIVNPAPPTNQPPTVNAGTDQTITLPTTTVTLNGTASDDGLPSETLTRGVVDGERAGDRHLRDPTATTTTATVSSAGTYVLQLSATDTVLTATDTVIVIVNSATASSVIRLNAGGGAFVDNLGQSWVADTPYVVGSTFTYTTGAAINGTVNDPLYQSERYGQSFGYQIPVTNGTYQVALHFAEIYWTSATHRVFDVTVEGTLAINDLDIWSMAGANAALVLPVTATVTDGVLNLALTTSVDNAKIAAIDVHPSSGGSNQPPTVNAGTDKTITLPTTTVTLTGTATDDGLPSGTLTVAWSTVSGPGTVTFGTPTATTTTATFSSAGTYVLQLSATDTVLTATDTVIVIVNPAAAGSVIRLNAGGGAFVDNLGQSWVADTPYVVGSTSTYTTSAAINGTVNDPLYQSERFGQSFGYQIPVTNGTYEVALHFAEIYWTSATHRVFDVTVEGTLVINDLDIWSMAGANAALVLPVTATVTDGVLNLALTTSVDNAKIAAIDVHPSSGGSNQPPTVNAGTDKTITLPTTTVTLTGTATDDGLPSGTLTVAWSTVSGPGTVTFGTPTATTTTATFSSAGTYVLQLSATDTVLTATDTVIVIVNSAAAGSVIRLNAGGGAFVDNLGQSWVADTPYVVGSTSTYTTSAAINGTVNDPLYQSERFGQSFGYQIPVTNGTYEVALHFAEIYWTSATHRVFDVTVEGALVINDLDIWSLAGANAALVMPVTATVTDGVLNLAFTTSVDNAKIAAIDVHPSSGGSNQPPTVNAGTDKTITLPTTTVTLTGTATDDGLPSGTLTVAWSTVSGPGTVTFGTPTATTTTATFSSAGTYVLQLSATDTVFTATDTVIVIVNPAAAGSVIRLNAGGGAFVDNLGQSWVADTPYVVGSTSTSTTGAAINGTVNDPLYQSERYGQSFGYQIPVTNGTYEVALHFAEIYWTSATHRVFDVTVEGTLVINDLDIWSLAGANAALVMPVTATVTDGVLNLALTTSVDNAKIAAIDVHPSSGGSNQPPTVNAGTDQTITLPTTTVTLTGTATDDGLPSGTLTLAWSTVSGPGTVTFGTPTATTTTATFSSAGTYVLQLSATDTALTATDTVIVIVNSAAAGSVIRLNAGGGAFVDNLGQSWVRRYPVCGRVDLHLQHGCGHQRHGQRSAVSERAVWPELRLPDPRHERDV